MLVPALGAGEPRHRPRPGRLHGAQEARGVFLMAAAVERPATGIEDFLERTREGPAALHHRGQRGRRQVHADRPPALRLQGRLRRPARVRPQGLSQPHRRAARFRAAHRRPARRARAGHHHRRGLPLLLHAASASSSSPTRRATSSTRATWPPGASTADLAIILIDARNGVLPQSRRHAVHRVAAGHSAHRGGGQQDGPGGFPRGSFRTRSATEFAAFCGAVADAATIQFIPISALEGDNVVTRSTRTPWYQGPGAAGVPGNRPSRARPRPSTDMRFPVQYVIRPDLDFRGFAGQVASGVVRPGDAVMVLPSGRTSAHSIDRDLRRRSAEGAFRRCR